MTESISPALARRIALAAQGLGNANSREVSGRALSGVIDRLGLLQIDSVNVFERSHYIPAFSRLGAYDRKLLDRLTTYPTGKTMEYWAHQAAIIPQDLWPMFSFRRNEFLRSGGDWGGWLNDEQNLGKWLRAELEANGPLPASAIEHDANERHGPWWGWSAVKRTLEWLFRTGEVVVVERKRFERVYALPTQVLPDSLLNIEFSVAEQYRALVARAASALGIATEADLADYWRMRRKEVRPAITELVDDGVLIPVEVAGWQTGSKPTPVWMHRDARRARKITACTLLSPFDPIVWYRPRTERLFDFHYRIEIYTPAPSRVFGYYSLPVLINDQLVGRVDLKSDRKAKVLRVKSAWVETEHEAGQVAERLAPTLLAAAGWQGFDEVAIIPHGNLASELIAHLR